MRRFLFAVGTKYKFRVEWVSITRFVNKLYFFLYFTGHKDNIHKRRVFFLCVLGFYMQMSMPYNRKFSYSNMPEITGRKRKQDEPNQHSNQRFK